MAKCRPLGSLPVLESSEVQTGTGLIRMVSDGSFSSHPPPSSLPYPCFFFVCFLCLNLLLPPGVAAIIILIVPATVVHYLGFTAVEEFICYEIAAYNNLRYICYSVMLVYM